MKFSNIMTQMIGIKKERSNFDKKIKDLVYLKQKGKCKICGGYISKYDRDYDHKNGNRSDNKISNCQLLHTRCHRKRHSLLVKSNKNKSIWKRIFSN